MPVSTRTARLLAVAAAGSIIALSAFVAPTLVRGQEQPAAGGAAAAPAAPTRPQSAMQAMQRALRTISSGVADPTKNSASLEAVITLQRESLNAKAAVPPMLAALADPEKTTKIGDYKKEMNKLIKVEIDLEEQLLAGDNTKAAASVQALNAIMQEGHGEFRPRRGGGGPGRGPGGGAPGGAPPAQ